MGLETFYDYDNCEYIVEKNDSDPDTLKFGFSCNCFEQIMQNGGQDMLDELYKDNLLSKDRYVQNSQITLGIDTTGIEKTQSKLKSHNF